MSYGRIAVVFGCVAALASGALAKGKAEEKKKDAAPDPMMAAMAKYMTPGPQHKMLTKAMVGSWNIAGKMWMDPTKPPADSVSTAEIRAVGDLWVVEDVKGDFMGKPFAGHGVHGYDLIKNKFVGSWVDNFGAYIMNSEGTADATGKVITTTANDFDPMTGKAGTVKGVTKIESDNKHTMAMFKTGPDGKEFKIMELVYTRK